MVKRISKKRWYLKSGYFRTEFMDVLNRTTNLLFNITMSSDISVKSAKRLRRIEMMLIELQMVDIERDD